MEYTEEDSIVLSILTSSGEISARQTSAGARLGGGDLQR
jgi:hypothetical protein